MALPDVAGLAVLFGQNHASGQAAGTGAAVAAAALNARTDAQAVARQTAPFAASCNVFAPRYRQVNIEVLGMDAKARDRYLAVSVADVTAAFSYYLKHLNGERPFVLASHSQGSNVVLEMLLRQPGLLDKDKLVAVYAPGWTFTDAHLAGRRRAFHFGPHQRGGRARNPDAPAGDRGKTAHGDGEGVLSLLRL